MFPPHQLAQYEIPQEVSYVEKHDLLKDDRSKSLTGTLGPHKWGTK